MKVKLVKYGLEWKSLFENKTDIHGIVVSKRSRGF